MIYKSSRGTFGLSKTVSTVLISPLYPYLAQWETWDDFQCQNSIKKSDFLKNWAILSEASCILFQCFRRLTDTIWALNIPYYQWYQTLPSLSFLWVSDPLEILKPQEKSHFLENSLKYLSDHLSNVLKWKYVISAF